MSKSLEELLLGAENQAAASEAVRCAVERATERERRRRVEAMRANFAQEGMHPDAEHAGLLERYITGTATLSDLLDHARKYAVTAQLRARDDAVRAARATVVLEGGSVSTCAQEAAVRYVLGEIGIDEFLELVGGVSDPIKEVSPRP
jgi:hypothetical protein